MKEKTYIALFAFTVLFSCATKSKPHTNQTEAQPMNFWTSSNDSLVDAKLLRWYFEVGSTSNPLAIDSAIHVIDSMMDRHKDNATICFKYIIQKINFYVRNKDFNEAIDLIKNDSNPGWELMGGNHRKKILEYRILATKSLGDGDDGGFRKQIENAFRETKNYISANQKDYDDFLRNDINSMRGYYMFVFRDYFEFCNILYGAERTTEELESLQRQYGFDESITEVIISDFSSDLSEFDIF